MFLITKNAAVLMPRSMNGRRLSKDYLASFERLLGHQDTALGLVPAHEQWVVALADDALSGQSCQAGGDGCRHEMRLGLCMGWATLVGFLIANLLRAHGNAAECSATNFVELGSELRLLTTPPREFVVSQVFSRWKLSLPPLCFLRLHLRTS